MIDTNEVLERVNQGLVPSPDVVRDLCDEIDRLRQDCFDKKMSEALCGVKPKPQGVTDEYLKESLGKLTDYIENTPKERLLDDLIKSGHVPASKPQGKTVRVAFKAFVDPFGNIEIPRFNMNAIGKDSQATPSFEGFTVNITADLPIPEETDIESEVENA